MTKAAALKKRYILFRYSGPPREEEPLKRALYAEALRFFGELGLSYVALKLVKYDANTKSGVLRCSRDYLDKTLGFLALLSSIEGSDARLTALKSSGTLKSLEMEFLSTHSR